MVELNYKEEPKANNTYIDKDGKVKPKLSMTYECQICKKRFQMFVETDNLSSTLDEHLFAKHKCWIPKTRTLNDYTIEEVGIGHLVSFEIIKSDSKDTIENKSQL